MILPPEILLTCLSLHGAAFWMSNPSAELCTTTAGKLCVCKDGRPRGYCVSDEIACQRITEDHKLECGGRTAGDWARECFLAMGVTPSEVGFSGCSASSEKLRHTCKSAVAQIGNSEGATVPISMPECFAKMIATRCVLKEDQPTSPPPRRTTTSAAPTPTTTTTTARPTTEEEMYEEEDAAGQAPAGAVAAVPTSGLDCLSASMGKERFGSVVDYLESLSAAVEDLEDRLKNLTLLVESERASSPVSETPVSGTPVSGTPAPESPDEGTLTGVSSNPNAPQSRTERAAEVEAEAEQVANATVKAVRDDLRRLPVLWNRFVNASMRRIREEVMQVPVMWIRPLGERLAELIKSTDRDSQIREEHIRGAVEGLASAVRESRSHRAEPLVDEAQASVGRTLGKVEDGLQDLRGLVKEDLDGLQDLRGLVKEDLEELRTLRESDLPAVASDAKSRSTTGTGLAAACFVLLLLIVAAVIREGRVSLRLEREIGGVMKCVADISLALESLSETIASQSIPPSAPEAPPRPPPPLQSAGEVSEAVADQVAPPSPPLDVGVAPSQAVGDELADDEADGDGQDAESGDYDEVAFRGAAALPLRHGFSAPLAHSTPSQEPIRMTGVASDLMDDLQLRFVRTSRGELHVVSTDADLAQ